MLMPKCVRKPLILTLLSIVLVGCLPPASQPVRAPIPTAMARPSLEAFETGQANPVVETSSQPVAVEYNLGETTITQAVFPEDNRFHNMPVRLNGIIALPDGEGAPYPVVVILHGNHPGCPIPEGDMVDRWPCDPEVERPNYRGFDYLVRRLAAQGYVALSININADNTFGFGEPVPIERLGQLVDLHLKALAEATGGGLNKFGVELTGRADLSRLAFIGHSQGGEGAYWLTQKDALDAPDAFTIHGYGPVFGLLMVAPSANWGGARGARVPLAVILPACDMDVFQQDGQLFYEITRLDPEQSSWASSVWLEGANHNYFNETLADEAVARPGRPDCETLLQPEVQRDFMSEYAIDFLAKIFNRDPGATVRLGMDFKTQASDELYGQHTRVAALASHPDRLPVFLPRDRSELVTNLAGGRVTFEGVTHTYCEAGYFIPAMKPGSEPCKRVNLVIPGNPAKIAVSWSQHGGALRLSLQEGIDLSQFSAISLRAAVDPLSALNKADNYQAFTIQLVDKQGNTASVQTRAAEPALRYPDGNKEKNDTFDGGLFTGRVPLTSIRAPLGDFPKVNLAEIREIVLLFDQTPSGSLFISDLELVR
jgi:dienelactone hydrolase